MRGTYDMTALEKFLSTSKSYIVGKKVTYDVDGSETSLPLVQVHGADKHYLEVYFDGKYVECR